MLQSPASRVHFLKFTEWLLSTQTKKMAGKRLFWWLMLCLLLLQQLFSAVTSIVTFNDAKPLPKAVS